MIKLIAVGKLKEQYLVNMVEDYKKRINKYHKLEIVENASDCELKSLELLFIGFNSFDLLYFT